MKKLKIIKLMLLIAFSVSTGEQVIDPKGDTHYFNRLSLLKRVGVVRVPSCYVEAREFCKFLCEGELLDPFGDYQACMRGCLTFWVPQFCQDRVLTKQDERTIRDLINGEHSLPPGYEKVY